MSTSEMNDMVKQMNEDNRNKTDLLSHTILKLE